METPYLPQSLFAEDFKKVYEPAEDTFLLLDALENDLDILIKDAQICMECGSGSGTVITALSKAFQRANTVPRIMIATDINMNACKTTRKCSSYHSQNIEVLRSDLALPLVDRLSQQIDVLIFNPPYVPTEAEEIESTSENCLNLSWAGGRNGRELIDRFLKVFVPRLLSKPRGKAYLVCLDRNDIDELTGLLLINKIRGTVVKERVAGIEHLYVIRYEWYDLDQGNIVSI